MGSPATTKRKSTSRLWRFMFSDCFFKYWRLGGRGKPVHGAIQPGVRVLRQEKTVAARRKKM